MNLEAEQIDQLFFFKLRWLVDYFFTDYFYTTWNCYCCKVEGIKEGDVLTFIISLKDLLLPWALTTNGIFNRLCCCCRHDNSCCHHGVAKQLYCMSGMAQVKKLICFKFTGKMEREVLLFFF